MSRGVQIADLADAIAGSIDEVSGALEGRQAFHARVAKNALAIIAREARQNPRPAELAYYREKTGCSDDADAALAFAEAIRNGDLDADDPEMLEALSGFIAARLAVDNPKFSTLARLKDLNA